jgi:fatty acid desaturase
MSAMKLNESLPQFDFKAKINRDVSALSEIQTLKQMSYIAFDWIVVTVSIVISQHYFNAATYILAVLVIAGRQHAMLAIMHEAAHLRLSKNHTVNDFLGNCLAAFPILAATEWYREHHGKHHRYLNSDQDPDWSRKVNFDEWKFPQSTKRFIGTISKQFIVGGYEWLNLMVTMSGLFPLRRLNDHNRAKTLALKATYYLVSLSVIFYFGLGSLFLIYWLVPLLIVFPALQRIRSISEHFGLAHTHELNATRNIESNWIERALLAPHNINFHLAHHLYPGVPHYNLNKLHQRLLTCSDYRAHAHQNDSYLSNTPKSLLKDLIKPVSEPK